MASLSKDPEARPRSAEGLAKAFQALGACYLAYFQILALVAPLALVRELLPQEPIPASALLDSVRKSRAGRARIKHLQGVHPERRNRGFLAEGWLGAILAVQLISRFQLVRVLLPAQATFPVQVSLLRPGLAGFFAWLTLGLMLTYGPLMLLDADLARLRNFLRQVASQSQSRKGPPSRPLG